MDGSWVPVVKIEVRNAEGLTQQGVILGDDTRIFCIGWAIVDNNRPFGR